MRVIKRTTKRFGGHYIWSPYHSICTQRQEDGLCCVGHFILDLGPSIGQKASLAALYRLMSSSDSPLSAGLTPAVHNVTREAASRNNPVTEMFRLKQSGRRAFSAKIPLSKAHQRKVRCARVRLWDNPRFVDKIHQRAAQKAAAVQKKWDDLWRKRAEENARQDSMRLVQETRRASRLQPKVVPSPMQSLFKGAAVREVGGVTVYKGGACRRDLFSGEDSLLPVLVGEGEELTEEESQLWHSDDSLLYVLRRDGPVACALVTESACKDELLGKPADSVAWYLFHLASEEIDDASTVLKAVESDCQVTGAKPCLAIVATTPKEEPQDLYASLGFQQTYWKRMKSLASDFTFDQEEVDPWMKPLTDQWPTVEFLEGDAVSFDFDRAPGGRGVGVVVGVEPSNLKSFNVAFTWRMGHRKFSFDSLTFVDLQTVRHYKKFESFLQGVREGNLSRAMALHDAQCQCWRQIRRLRTSSLCVDIQPASPDELPSETFQKLFACSSAVYDVPNQRYQLLDGEALDSLDGLEAREIPHAVMLGTSVGAASRRQQLDLHYIRVPPQMLAAWLHLEVDLGDRLGFVLPCRPNPWPVLPREMVVLHAPNYAPLLVVVLGPRLSDPKAPKPLEVVSAEWGSHWSAKLQWLFPMAKYPDLCRKPGPVHLECEVGGCCLTGLIDPPRPEY
ncbi:MAG: hypothetical protein KVP17_003566 [Porospora cf. gigantea B]|uniref:uncharacterized protein n=1 Tax=Porospora cf. gigantea B TaxID=2853592 RepID=UPI003571936B|nr:MAG: hypothetical protein KVP17_003566 [Porospora cf. gigantea B]